LAPELSRRETSRLYSSGDHQVVVLMVFWCPCTRFAIGITDIGNRGGNLELEAREKEEGKKRKKRKKKKKKKKKKWEKEKEEKKKKEKPTKPARPKKPAEPEGPTAKRLYRQKPRSRIPGFTFFKTQKSRITRQERSIASP
jgi:sRNA-binding protein